ncbi:MAG: class I SAM-dependent methyltransferase [Oligoflexia bacterium]|nr:class I SAM-dependent methyltransferase [Oligoflexia bacterium]
MKKNNLKLNLTYNSNLVKKHYEDYPYPQYPLVSSIRKIDTYSLNVYSLWSYFNCKILRVRPNILLAGSGSFSPYPTAIANNDAEKIWALDLSKKNLRRARLHCFLHGIFLKVKYLEEDLLNFNYKKSFFHFIDCYGVIHHISNDKKALKNIHDLLVDDGIARIMVYSKGARSKIESVRRAFKLLKINKLWMIKKLMAKAQKKKINNNREYQFLELIENNYEANFDSGIADMFLHPYAKTYSIEQLITLIDECSLVTLRFTHNGAITDTTNEIERLKILQKEKKLFTNFILFVGKKKIDKIDKINKIDEKEYKSKLETYISLNPIIKKYLKFWSPFPQTIANKFFTNKFAYNLNLNYQQKKLLAHFKIAKKRNELELDKSCEEYEKISTFLDSLMLIEYTKDM